jgi:SecD/SecF fusion protein
VRVIRSAFPLALLAVTVVLLGGRGASGAAPTCSVAPTGPSLELLYRLEAGKEAVTPHTRDEAVEIVCRRLRAIGKTSGEVRLLADGRIRVLIPRVGNSRRVGDRIGVPGQLYFYDWEPNLIGRERRIGGHPGLATPPGALREAMREWAAAGRDVGLLMNKGLIYGGAFPTAYGAVRLASEQKPRERCSACSASTPRFYMFERSTHRLIAGPVTDRDILEGTAFDRHARSERVVFRVPVGTVIASEQPTNSVGEPVTAAEPGWFALRDRPALSGEEIVDPRQEFDVFNQPNITFGFTESGRVAFERVTRAIASRGEARATGPVTGREAEELSGRFALILDDEIKTLPIIDFSQNPNGIDGRTGAQIAGGFSTVREARELAATLRIGALPINLVLVRG